MHIELERARSLELHVEYLLLATGRAEAAATGLEKADEEGELCALPCKPGRAAATCSS